MGEPTVAEPTVAEPTVAEVMTRHLITAAPDTGFNELIGTLTLHELSAVPVLDPTGRPVGVVSERDLLTKLEYHGGTDPAPLLPGSCRERWRKSRALTAAEVMSAPAITAPAPVGVIHADIENALAETVHPPHRVTVQVHDAMVTLDGTVNLCSTALPAVRIAHHVSGVIAVRNNIHFDVDDHMITGM